MQDKSLTVHRSSVNALHRPYLCQRRRGGVVAWRYCNPGVIRRPSPLFTAEKSDTVVSWSCMWLFPVVRGVFTSKYTLKYQETLQDALPILPIASHSTLFPAPQEGFLGQETLFL